VKRGPEIYIHATVHRNRFLFNNQSDAPIIQIYSVIKFYKIEKNEMGGARGAYGGGERGAQGSGGET
jgi:hypothetical protein